MSPLLCVLGTTAGPIYQRCARIVQCNIVSLLCFVAVCVDFVNLTHSQKQHWCQNITVKTWNVFTTPFPDVQYSARAGHEAILWLSSVQRKILFVFVTCGRQLFPSCSLNLNKEAHSPCFCLDFVVRLLNLCVKSKSPRELHLCAGQLEWIIVQISTFRSCFSFQVFNFI